MPSGNLDETTGPYEVALPSVPGYEVRRELGRGGMGIVYEAQHILLKRVVALKTVRVTERVTPEGLRHLRTEAEAVARLQHPNIVQIFDIDEYEGAPYLAFEFCPVAPSPRG